MVLSILPAYTLTKELTKKIIHKCYESNCNNYMCSSIRFNLISNFGLQNFNTSKFIGITTLIITYGSISLV